MKAKKIPPAKAETASHPPAEILSADYASLLADDLRQEFPGIKGFSSQNLWYMRQFHLEYRGNAKLQPLVGEIAWSRNLAIMSRCKEPLEREFYLRMTRKFGWSRSVLVHQIEYQS